METRLGPYNDWHSYALDLHQRPNDHKLGLLCINGKGCPAIDDSLLAWRLPGVQMMGNGVKKNSSPIFRVNRILL